MEASRQGKPVTVVTCFSVTNYLPTAGKPIHPANATLIRTREDEAFVNLLGPSADLRALGFFDVALRPGGREKFLDRSRIADDDMEIVQTLAGILSRLVGPGAALFLPMGFGGHIDHRITREGALRVLPSLDAAAFMYEDLPYVEQIPENEAEAFTRVLLEENGLEAGYLIFSGDTLLEDKKRCLSVYTSQINPETSEAVERHARRLIPGREGERFWRLGALA